MQGKIRKLLFFMAVIMPFNTIFASVCATVNEIQPNVYIKNGQNGEVFIDEHLANNSFIIGEKAIVVIDTGGSKSEGEALLCAIRKLSDLPITHVINTHVHPDHILGNVAFKSEDTKFVGHKNLTRAIGLLGPTYVERLLALQGPVMSDGDLISPDILVENELVIDLGGRNLRINTVKQSHTDNDLTVYDEQTGILWLGDLLFVGHIPVLGGNGSVNGWLDFMIELQQAKDKYTRFIPGHGKQVTSDDPAFKQQTAYLTAMRNEVRQWLTDDKPLSGALSSIGTQQAGEWPMAEIFHKRNISYMYSELEWE